MTKIIDPVLTTVVQGYANPEYVGDTLFPRIPVQSSGGQVIEFNHDSWRVYNSQRAPGSDTKRIQIGFKGTKYALENHSLEGKVPRENLRDAQVQMPGLNLGFRTTKAAYDSLLKGLEVQQAKLATNPASYPASNKLVLAGASQWSDPDSDPLADFDNGREAIRAQCGTYPNTVVIGPKAWRALRNHPKVVARLTYSSDGKAINEAMIAALIDIETVKVGKAVWFNDATGASEDVWGNHMVMGYVPAVGLRDQETPSFGYTYEMEGHPLVEPPYYDNNSKTFYYPVTHERAPVIAGITAGYLISNVSA